MKVRKAVIRVSNTLLESFLNLPGGVHVAAVLPDEDYTQFRVVLEDYSDRFLLEGIEAEHVWGVPPQLGGVPIGQLEYTRSEVTVRFVPDEREVA